MSKAYFNGCKEIKNITKYIIFDTIKNPFMKPIPAYLILIFLFLNHLSLAQQMPLDFSDPAENFSSFLNSSFSLNTDPENSSNEVGQFFNDGSNSWQGFYLDLQRVIDLDFQNTISLSFYRFDPNAHTVLIKLENGQNPDVEVSQNIPAGGGWTNNVVFDFSQAVLSNDGTPVNATGEYSKLVVFIDGGVTTSGTYLLDNIDDGSTEVNLNEIDVEYTNLVWEDQFETPGVVNPSNWHHQTQVIIPGVGWANGEEQHYTNRVDNSFVDTSGFLNIVAKQETYTDQGLTKNYTSARLNAKFAFTYGRVDVRAKIPVEAGTWPAIWTLGKNINENGAYWDPQYGTTSWPACGEIDMMEHGIFPNQDINYIKSSLHTPCCYAGDPNGGGTIASDLENDFHVYSLNWSPDQITFLLDGVGYYTYNPAVKDDSTWPFYEDQFVLLNIAMGGYAGNISSGFNQATMLIDYVKIYQEGELAVGENIDLEDKVIVYPTPSSDVIYIETKTTPGNLQLLDMSGKKVHTQRINSKSVDVSDLSAGIYFLVITSNNLQIVKKVIIN